MEQRIRVWSPSQQECEPHNLPPEPGLAGSTLRQNFRPSLAGSAARFLFSNEYGDGKVEIAGAMIAPSLGMDRIDGGRSRRLSFGGAEGVTLPPGGTAWSDPVDFRVVDRAPLSADIRFGACPGKVTAHPGSRTTSYLSAGDALGAVALPDAARTEHWYFLAGMDLVPDGPARTFVAIGDSLTDGRGTTTDGDTRWTDALLARIRSAGMSGVAVVNSGLGGNRVLRDGLGPSTRSRYRRDALDLPGAAWMLVFEGVNDIGTLCGELGAAAVVEELTDAYAEMAAAAREKVIRTVGATITPFGGSQYDTPADREARNAVNEWIRGSGVFDVMADFDAAVRDADDPERLAGEVDSGDHLHLCNEGYRRLAGAVDLDLFRS